LEYIQPLTTVQLRVVVGVNFVVRQCKIAPRFKRSRRSDSDPVVVAGYSWGRMAESPKISPHLSLIVDVQGTVFCISERCHGAVHRNIASRRSGDCRGRPSLDIGYGAVRVARVTTPKTQTEENIDVGGSCSEPGVC
jgi:hypothetical protein